MPLPGAKIPPQAHICNFNAHVVFYLLLLSVLLRIPFKSGGLRARRLVAHIAEHQYGQTIYPHWTDILNATAVGARL